MSIKWYTYNRILQLFTTEYYSSQRNKFTKIFIEQNYTITIIITHFLKIVYNIVTLLRPTIICNNILRNDSAV